MNWTELVKTELEGTYGVTENLFKLVEPGDLSWKPATGSNWMSTAQLVMHCTNACGAVCKGFVTGDWGMPEGMSIEDLKPEDMLPSADKMPAVESMEQAFALLAEDKQTALAMIDQSGETELATKVLVAPWDGTKTPRVLGYHMLNMVEHLGSHKAQLFYYLKLMGKPVNTENLWGK